ncbi:Methylesterase 2 [Forsythia ovata]|uniref:Methylesterase 2 n=1 Tax=Forsythia ovata TaxID=205694 RepID=A0ABD1WSK0_9LAMI
MESNNGMEKTLKKKHFVLVHGACHGAWSWYKVVALLRAEGHRVTALDMAAAGVHPTQVEELRSFSDYCKPLMEFMATLPPDDTVVLVGHSMGGISISVAMEMFPRKIAVAIFVTAFMPADLSVPVIIQECNRQMDHSFMDSQISFSKEKDKTPCSIIFGSKFLSTVLYQLSPPEDLSLATLLVRPIGLYDDAEMLKETFLSTQNYGSVPRAYIISEEDKFIKEDSQKWMIQNNPTDDVKTICGSDHMEIAEKSKSDKLLDEHEQLRSHLQLKGQQIDCEIENLFDHADFGRMVHDFDEEEMIGESNETPIEKGIQRALKFRVSNASMIKNLSSSQVACDETLMENVMKH